MNQYTINDIKPGFVFFITENPTPYIALILSEIDQKTINVYFSDIKVSTIFSKASILNALNNSEFHLKGTKVD